MRHSASSPAPLNRAPPSPRFTARHAAFAAVAQSAVAAAAGEVKGGEVCCCVGAAAAARDGVTSRTSAGCCQRRVRSCVVSSGWVLFALLQGGRRAQRAGPMLDLEVVPERSLGNEQWEFTLGECGFIARPHSLAPSASGLCPGCPCGRRSSPLHALRSFGSRL